jgi:peptidoglycan/xylan/chitin deacetylase (PgdA/CDA1 family)
MWHRKYITILMLHGVMDKELTHSTWLPMRKQLAPRLLDNALKVLKKKYKFISLEHAVDMLTGSKPIESHCMVLTFDDGYRNNLTHALPILLKYEVPATIFLSTGHITRREPFWYDRMDYAIQHLRQDCAIRLDSKVIQFFRKDRKALAAAFKELRYALKDNPDNYANTLKKINKIVAELEDQAEKKLTDIFEIDPWTALMTWEEVKKAAQNNVTFGSHTVDHVLLGKLEENIIREQLIMSKQSIENHTRTPCLSLCYPSGSFSSQAIDIAKQCGYTSAVTTMNGLNHPAKTSLFALFRNSFPSSEQDASILGGASGLISYLQKNSNYRLPTSTIQSIEPVAK